MVVTTFAAILLLFSLTGAMALRPSALPHWWEMAYWACSFTGQTFA
jgi:hypothetical protein